jgi:serine/threonine protein kinase
MSEPEANLAGTFLGNRRYRVEREIGRGGMGSVWLANDESLQEPVALKLLPDEIRYDPVALDDMRRETARSRRLSHPNIVRIHDLHEFPGEMPFISMEYIDGASLSRFKTEQTCRCLPWDFVQTLLGQLCAALDYAHGENLIHRDLKPGNVMLDSRGRLKLADFGIAAVVSDSMSRVSLQGNTSGTPAYMSPQQMDGRTPRVTDDIYALGATLYDLLTGKPPFFRGDILHQVRNLEPPTIEDRLDEFGLKNPIPPDVSAMIMACLAKDPEKRPQSAATLASWIGIGLNQEASFGTLSRQVFDTLPPTDSPSSRELTVITSDEVDEETVPDTLPPNDDARLTGDLPLPYVPDKRRSWKRPMLIGGILILALGIAFAASRKKESRRNPIENPPVSEEPFAGPWLTEKAFTIENDRLGGMNNLHAPDHLRNCTVITLERADTDAPIVRHVEPWLPKNRVWSIKDGIIRGHLRSDQAGSHKSYLVFNGLNLENFVLTFAFLENRQAVNAGNFGVFYHSRNLEGWWLDGYSIVLGEASGHLGGAPEGTYSEEEREMSQAGLKRSMRDFLTQAARARLYRNGGHLASIRVAGQDLLHVLDQSRGRYIQIKGETGAPQSGTIALEVWIEGPGEMTVEFEGLAFRAGFGSRGPLF